MYSDYYDGSLFIEAGQGGNIITLLSQGFLCLANSTTPIKLNEIITSNSYITYSPGSGASE
jgi:hypothetical protein